MTRSDRAYRLLSITILTAILLNFPILGIFSSKMLVWGLPLLYLYLFIIWISTIIFTWLIVRNFEPRNR
ncbi:MAG: hypothetical protein ACK4TA_19365 [Saprospiraceae bacterium]